MRLTTKVHDRDAAGMTYVYPVVSRRAEGVSVGVNLNPNNACNWRCVYCQVPGLTYGSGPEIDLELLRSELARMLDALVNGDYLERHVPEGSRRLNDVAFSGNGEPTSSPRFADAVGAAVEALRDFELLGRVKIVLITNGSLVHRPEVQAGLKAMAPHGGEVWFKLDSATDEGQAALNSNRAGVERSRKSIRAAAAACPTWIQTMVLARNGLPPSEEERAAYLDFVDELVRDRVPVKGVLLYGIERRSHQPEAAELSALSPAWLEAWAERIRSHGLPVRLF